MSDARSSDAVRHRYVIVACNVVAVGVVLAGLWWFVGRGITSVDEGLVLAQAHRVLEGRDYAEASSMPGGLPTGTATPWGLDEHGENGSAPYAKLPLYVVVVAGSLQLGAWGPVALSLVGLVAAAYCSSRIARALRPKLEVPSLWVCALASPLLFNGFLVWAHTFGAALFGAAVLALRSAIAGRRLSVVLFACVLAIGTQVRQEFVLVALAFGMVLAAQAWRSRDVLLGVLGGAAFVAGVSGFVLARAWRAALLGDAVAGYPYDAQVSTDSWPVGRWNGFVSSMLEVTGPTTAISLVLIVAVLAGASGYLVRRHRMSVAMWLLIVASAISVVAVIIDRGFWIDGLLVAFPPCIFGALIFRWGQVESYWLRTSLLSTFVGFVLILLTQYPEGGGFEWGGRYFAWAIPLLAAVLLWTLSEADLQPRMQWVVLLLIPVILWNVVGLLTIRETHTRSDALARVVAATRGDEEIPIVFTNSFTARSLYMEANTGPAARVQPEQGADELIRHLRSQGVREFVVVGGGSEATLDAFAAAGTVKSEHELNGKRVLKVELTQP